MFPHDMHLEEGKRRIALKKKKLYLMLKPRRKDLRFRGATITTGVSSVGEALSRFAPYFRLWNRWKFYPRPCIRSSKCALKRKSHTGGF
jgi:hypothetical protein